MFVLGLTGSVADFNTSVPDYDQLNCYEFEGPGHGQGMCVKDNASSAWNRTTGDEVTVKRPGFHAPSGFCEPAGWLASS